VYQRRGLERSAWHLAGQAGACELAQLVVHQEQELSNRLPVASLDVGQDPGDVALGPELPGAARRRGPAPRSFVDGPEGSEVTGASGRAWNVVKSRSALIRGRPSDRAKPLRCVAFGRTGGVESPGM
jgi:hypothetical protein